MAMASVVAAIAVAAAGLVGCATADAPESGDRWWKGNLHTHSLWSDGDSYPEQVVAWYRDNGYHFLGLSEHDLLPEGEKWIHPTRNRFTRGRGAETLTRYRERFGPDWVDTRVVDDGFRAELARVAGLPPGPDAPFARSPRPDELVTGDTLVRVRPVAEFRHLFEEPDAFLLLGSEEIAGPFSVHVNATNVVEHTPVRHGRDAVETAELNLRAILDQGERTGRPVLAHLNHPNYLWAFTAEELAWVESARFFEVYNGHPLVATGGDEEHVGVERMWDIVLTLRLAELGHGLVYGLAVDDAHEYGVHGIEHAEPGRGWVVVRAPELTADHLVSAIHRGEFYASTGVRLKDVSFDGRRYRIEIDEEPGARYRTTFIGTRRGYDGRSEPVTGADGEPLPVTRRYSAEVGAILAEVDGPEAVYELAGDEIYVRATIVSDRPKPRPSWPDERWEKAWTQPVVPRAER